MKPLAHVQSQRQLFRIYFRDALATHMRQHLTVSLTPSLSIYIYLRISVLLSASLSTAAFIICGRRVCPCARFRTLLTFQCPNSAPTINYFSNPDVTYLGTPTGTPTNDNARAIRDNMVSRNRTKRKNHPMGRLSHGLRSGSIWVRVKKRPWGNF